jgi:hypothetical protein
VGLYRRLRDKSHWYSNIYCGPYLVLHWFSHCGNHCGKSEKWLAGVVIGLGRGERIAGVVDLLYCGITIKWLQDLSHDKALETSATLTSHLTPHSLTHIFLHDDIMSLYDATASARAQGVPQKRPRTRPQPQRREPQSTMTIQHGGWLWNLLMRPQTRHMWQNL